MQNRRAISAEGAAAHQPMHGVAIQHGNEDLWLLLGIISVHHTFYDPQRVLSRTVELLLPHPPTYVAR